MNKRNMRKQNWTVPTGIFFIFLLFFLVLYLQFLFIALSPIVSGINVKEFAKRRNTEKRKLYASRGTIYDKDGNILALNVASYTVIAFLEPSRTVNKERPQHVVDKAKTAKELAPILDMDEEYLLNLLNRDAYQVELGPGGRDITELKKDEILALNLPGLGFIENQKRYYPNGDFASYIIGYAKRYEEFVETKNGVEAIYNIIGELGIESKFNEQLKGKDGSLTYQRDQHGFKIPDTREIRINAINGHNIYLTIDAAIQRFIEAEVKGIAENYNPEWVQITVMDAKSGKILGSASTPSFDPNILNITNYENPLTSYLFEPGSTMKTYTYMCAIEKGTYLGNDIYTSGKIKIGDSYVSDWNQKGWGDITFDKGYEYSSNVAIANLLQTVLDKKDLLECYKKYGFGKETDIDLPRELVGNLKFNYPIEVAAAGFGQGITTTAIQHLQALTMIANDGTMLKPYIVDKVIDPNNNEIVYEGSVKKVENVVSKPTIDKMRQLMHNVMYGEDEGTTGRSYSIEGFDIIGKTGTAEIYDNKTNRYLTGYNDYIYSFSGIFPNKDPEIIIYAAMKRPEHSRGFGLSSGTKSVMKNIAKYLKLYTEANDNLEQIKYTVESYISKDTKATVDKLLKKNIKPIVIGEGDRIVNQYPRQGIMVLNNDKILLKTNSQKITMPNIIGWSRNDILNFCNLINLKCEFEDYGYAIEQSILQNEIINFKIPLKVKLNQKYDIKVNKEEVVE